MQIDKTAIWYVLLYLPIMNDRQEPFVYANHDGWEEAIIVGAGSRAQVIIGPSYRNGSVRRMADGAWQN